MITVHPYKNMFRYEIYQGDLAVEVMQFRETDGPWKTMMSSVLRIGCGMAGDRLGPFEMVAELITLVRELRMVLIVLDNAQRQMGDEYAPPLMPFKDEYLPKYPIIEDISAAVKDLYIALDRRSNCDTCGGRGLVYGGDVEVDVEPCDCVLGAIIAMSKHNQTFKAVLE